MSNVPNFESLPLHQEQHGVVRFHYLLKKMPTQMYATMKEAYGEQTLACSTIFHRHQQFAQRRASASPKPKSGRLVVASTKATVNMIGTMLADDDSLSQWQIALVGISQTTVKKIIISLFFPAISIGVYAYAFTQNVRTGVLFALSGWFFHRRCNKLWAKWCFSFTFSIRGVPDS